jgi:hypothetical protein
VIASLFQVGCEELFVCEQGLLLYQAFQLFVLSIEMFNRLIDSILAYIFPWEGVAIRGASSQRNGVVHEIDVFLSPLFEVLDKSVVVMSLWQVISAVLVVAY